MCHELCWLWERGCPCRGREILWGEGEAKGGIC